MRALAAFVLCVGLTTACSDAPAPAPADTGAKPAAPSLIDIPRLAGVPAATGSIPPVGKGDIEDISERSYLRVLVTPGQTHFSTADGRHHGRTVDAMDAFAAFLNNTVARPVSVAYIATPEDALVADLLAGKGDIAANVRVTFERDDQVAFASPVRSGIREWIVTGPAVQPLVSLEDVGGRTIHVRRGSDHHASLIRLNEQLKKIDRPPARIAVGSATQTDEDLVNLVNTGAIPATIVDDYIFGACCGSLGAVKINRDVAVSQDGVIAWATRKDAPKLQSSINAFFAKYRLTF